ncbi:DUF2513 domain-containing protein [Providencia rettgeri]|uniref:DUF2513 domain-containing protein n=1 Tax=Providencia rettgeri TaxID=587 RepID=UPI001F04DF9A|nr:DUF2513 domain-containing protein [Providencia rettgeri]MCG9951641.1 DUF2513 domain-containing protein [Providencia rettgeri]
MHIDLDEFKRIINTFLDSPKAHITSLDLTNPLGNSPELLDKFIFHIQLMVENKLVSNIDLVNESLNELGIIRYPNFMDKFKYVPMPIRLTQAGHDFAAILNEKPILEELKTKLKDAPFDILMSTGKSLLMKIIENKLEPLLR